MSHLKGIYSIMLLLIAVSCSKSIDERDEKPPESSHISAVKAAMVGTWTFHKMIVTQISSGETITASHCDKVAIIQDWMDITVFRPVFVFHNAFSADYFHSYCLTFLRQIDVKQGANCTVIEQSDKTVNIRFSTVNYEMEYNIDIADISSTMVKVKILNKAGLIIKYEFERS